MYIMDPYCGWCYANSKNILELSKTYEIEIIPAGMWADINARTTKETKDFITKGSRIVTAKTGVQFTTNYFNLFDQNINFNSEIPSRAINTIKEILKDKTNQKIVEFTHEIFISHYFKGKDLNQIEIYKEICDKLNINKEDFKKEFNSETQKHNTQTEFNRAYQLAKKISNLNRSLRKWKHRISRRKF